MADTDLEVLAASAVSSGFVSAQLYRARADTKLILLDCCYSGAFTKSFGTKGDTKIDPLTELKGSGRVVITASSALQYSFEGRSVTDETPQSTFTRHLVSGLQTGAADLDGDGQISVDELYKYVFERVIADNPAQRPNISTSSEALS